MVFVRLLILTLTSVHAMPMPVPISGDVELVTVSEIFMEENRIKRSDGDACQFPSSLLFQFDVKGAKIVLQLEKNTLLSRRVPIYITKSGKSYEEKFNDTDEEFATYQDVVRGSSMLVFCQEDGTFRLHGSFRHAGEMYRISHSGVPEPSPIHYIQRSQEMRGSYRDDVAILPNETYEDLLGSSSMRKKSCEESEDAVGDTDENIIELFFTADASVYNYFLDDHGKHKRAVAMLELFVVLLANEIDLYFYSVTLLDPSLSIKIFMAGIEIPEPGSEASWSSSSQFTQDGTTYVETGVVLKYIKRWTRKHRSDVVQYDHLMALTRLTLASKDLYILGGQAVIGKLCNHPNSLSVIGSAWTQFAATAAHELAHNLDVYHDGTKSAKSCSMKDLNLMSPLLPYVTDLIYAETISTFSLCSIDAIKCYINSLGDENCMKQHSFSDLEFEAQKSILYPGTVYSLDQQCQLFQGLSSYSCVDRLNESSCYAGYACSTSPNLSEGCSPGSFPLYPLAGTPCGEPDDDTWCYRGLCRPRQTSSTAQPATTTTSTTVSPFCSKKCCVRKSNGKKKCCNGLKCCEVDFGQKLDCCTLCNQVHSVSTTMATTTKTNPEQCYDGECCKRIIKGNSKKKVCCTGKKCCKRSWGINTKCCKTCG